MGLDLNGREIGQQLKLAESNTGEHLLRPTLGNICWRGLFGIYVVIIQTVFLSVRCCDVRRLVLYNCNIRIIITSVIINTRYLHG